ncbi:MAG: glycosyltransferase [Clostridia bacterium]|nr:glycosyltransferase [Clostridia bacterium]
MDRQTDITQEQALVKLAFVILNYNTYEETIACIHSIHDKIDTEDYRIVVVDNASTDDSLENLREAFPSRSGSDVSSQKIELLCNKENLGFARGNNVGIRYVNEKYRPEFVVVLNSDTELIQRDLYSKLSQEYAKSGFALLGPMILTADGRYTDSPKKQPIKEELLRELKACERHRFLLNCGLYNVYLSVRKLIMFCLDGVKNFSRQKDTYVKQPLNSHQYQKQVVLQGAFLVFSKKAFESIAGFNESTFLYYEEQLLYLNLLRHSLTIVYDPEICIYHKQGRATDNSRGTSRRKDLFLTQCLIDSNKVLLRDLDKYYKGRIE